MIFVFMVIAVAYSCRILAKFDIGGVYSNYIRSALYLLLFFLWAVSIDRRIIQKQTLHCLRLTAALMLVWLVLRTLKYEAALAYISDGKASSALLYASVVLMLVSAAAELTAGIIGIINCKKPEKAGICMAWGVIVAVLCVASTILNSAGGGSFSVFFLILGLVLPVLYIIGAVFNKKEHIA